jgi:hypothetical protein
MLKYLDSIYTLPNTRLDIEDSITPQTCTMQKLLGDDNVSDEHGNKVATNTNGIRMS